MIIIIIVIVILFLSLVIARPTYLPSIISNRRKHKVADERARSYNITQVTQQSKYRDLSGKNAGYTFKLRKIQRGMNKDNPNLLQTCVSMVPVKFLG